MQGWDRRPAPRPGTGRKEETIDERLPPAALRDGLRLLGRYKLELVFRLTGYAGAMRKIRAAKEQEAAASAVSGTSPPQLAATKAGDAASQAGIKGIEGDASLTPHSDSPLELAASTAEELVLEATGEASSFHAASSDADSPHSAGAEMGAEKDSPRALSPTVRTQMEGSFGQDFGDVKVHVDSHRVSGTTQALTEGSEVHFAPGRYQPGTLDGNRLIGHELAHVVQQRGGEPMAQPFDAAARTSLLEQEADRAGEAAARNQPAEVRLAAVPSLAQRFDPQRPPEHRGDPTPASIAKLTPGERRWRAAKLGAPEIPEEMIEQLLVAIPVTLGAWGASQFLGVGLITDAVMAAMGGYSAYAFLKDLWIFWTHAGVAKTDDELRQAGKHLAAAAAAVGVAGMSAKLGHLPHGPKAPVATPEQKAIVEIFELAPDLVATFPHLGKMGPTPSNLSGLKRIVDTLADSHLGPELRQQFLGELQAKVGAANAPPEKLFLAMNEVAQAKPELYLRRGVRPSADYIDKDMGGLSRLVSLKAALFSLTTDEWWARATKELPDLPPRGEADWGVDGNRLVELVKSGRISFDHTRDLNPAALVQGRTAGASAWLFARRDAGSAINRPGKAVTRLGLESDYSDGYLVMEISTTTAVEMGAARPTALDLTLSPAGRLNPHVNEPAGRTHPIEPGQRQVRELVLPPLPLSSMSNITFVKVY